MMIWQIKIFGKYLENICTMKGAWDQNIIFRFFSELHKIWVHAKFQSGLTPPSGFLPIDIPFLANIWREYFSFNILTVLYQSELELSDLDQNWAKTRHLLFKTFESSNAMDSPIVHCPVTRRKWNWAFQTIIRVNKWTTVLQKKVKVILTINWANRASEESESRVSNSFGENRASDFGWKWGFQTIIKVKRASEES